MLVMFWNNFRDLDICFCSNMHWILKHFLALVSVDFSQCDGIFSLVEK